MRLFIASRFPPEVLRDLDGRVSAIRSRLPAASWVRAEAQHLTFAFLGEREEALVEQLAQPLCSALATIPRFEASLKGCGFFPNPRHARVGWVGLDPEQQFSTIARAVRDVVTKHGVELDRADFRPHLTLMRMREGWPPSSIDLFSKTLRDHRSAPFVVDEIILFSSQLDPKGAIHTPLRTFPLAVSS
ncbi:MAG TPA: RNA 2',3'-cyclic phosphodiesterase [Thermoanaerobaculia bacterium]|nr:RNA 2',3'-cyclic phosphodiesterase [Thermoanaerobaculia bacterium]